MGSSHRALAQSRRPWGCMEFIRGSGISAGIEPFAYKAINFPEHRPEHRHSFNIKATSRVGGSCVAQRWQHTTVSYGGWVAGSRPRTIQDMALCGQQWRRTWLRLRVTCGKALGFDTPGLHPALKWKTELWTGKAAAMAAGGEEEKPEPESRGVGARQDALSLHGLLPPGHCTAVGEVGLFPVEHWDTEKHSTEQFMGLEPGHTSSSWLCTCWTIRSMATVFPLPGVKQKQK